MSVVRDARLEGRRATVEDIIAEGEQIWAAVKAKDFDRTDSATADAFLVEMRKQFPDFAYSLPLVLKWIVTMKDYNDRAFKKYVQWYVKYSGKPKDRLDFLKNQSEYLVFLFKARHPRTTPVVMRQFRDEINKRLEDEDKEFKEMADDAKGELQDMADECDDTNRDELYKLVQKLRDGTAQKE